MIDTMRFKIRVSDEFIHNLKQKSVGRFKHDFDVGLTISENYSSFVTTPSWSTNISVFSADYDNYVFIEFSLPKYYFGHNIYMLDLDDANLVLARVHLDLLNFYGDLPSPEEWEVNRLDLCYAWKFDRYDTANAFVQALKTTKVKNHITYTYPTSVMFKGQTLSYKFYLKQPEFFNESRKKSDYVRLKQINENLANELLDYSSSVLRFEMTFRKMSLIRIFNKKTIHIQDVLSFDIITLMSNYFFNAIQNMQGKPTTLSDVKRKLMKSHGKKLSSNLFLFYILSRHQDSTALKIFETMVDRTTVYRYKKYIQKLGIPLFNCPDFTEYDFSVPSIYGVRKGEASGSEQVFSQ